MSFGFAVLGTGLISKDMRTALAQADDTVHLAAVGSRSLDVAKEFVSHYHKRQASPPGAFGSYKEAIESPEVHAVYVGLPTGLKEEVVMQIVAAGKHVLCDKPFASLASLKRMVEATHAKGLLFMDATHFAHSKRTHAIRQQLERGAIGTVQRVSASFFAAQMDEGNIRNSPSLEPLGAVGDLGWYTARAAVEYLLPQTGAAAGVTGVSSHHVRSKAEGTVTSSTSLVSFAKDLVLTSVVGFTGAWDQSLSIIGSHGTIKVNDFLLDHHNSGVFVNPHLPLKFEVYTGSSPLPSSVHAVGGGFDFNKPPRSSMFEAFAKAAKSPTSYVFWATQSFRTQEIVDAMFNGKIDAVKQ